VGLHCQEVDDYIQRRETVDDYDHALVLSDSVRVADDDWCGSLVLRRWPREVAPGWLGNALAGDIPVDVALHVEPQDPQRIARFLKRQT
jgi:hypothetical protein